VELDSSWAKTGARIEKNSQPDPDSSPDIIGAMNLKNRCVGVVGILLTAIVPLAAQILPPNSAGVAAGHAHIYVTDQAASNAFWTALGGIPLEQGGAFPWIKFPGVILLFAQTGGGGRGGAAGGAARGGTVTPREGSVGSAVESLGFKVKSLRDTLAKLDAIGARPVGPPRATSATLMSPEKVKVELVQDAALPTAVASEDVLIKTSDPAASAAWYEKWFGARVVKENGFTVAQIPGWNLRFSETKETVAGMRGRALDHIGFDVPSVNDYMKKLGDGGVSITPFNLGRGAPIGFVADPWGISIELNEGVRNMK
jgi:catechol 2,3-dioxygenase-like lactoylglutathione lyase family enzyme